MEDNKTTLTMANAAVTAGDYEGFLSFCTEDTEWTFIGNQTLKGKEAVRQYMKKTYIEPPKFIVENLIAEGDFVTALGKISVIDTNNKTTHYNYCDVWQFREGKLDKLNAYVIEI